MADFITNTDVLFGGLLAAGEKLDSAAAVALMPKRTRPPTKAVQRWPVAPR